MLGWFVRLLLVISGSITSWFVSKDALHFNIVQMAIAVLLFTLILLIVAFAPALVNRFKQRKKKKT